LEKSQMKISSKQNIETSNQKNLKSTKLNKHEFVSQLRRKPKRKPEGRQSYKLVDLGKAFYISSKGR